jgi:lipid-A-disaccharide synthase
MRYYLIAGERSGDLHGANLIKALKNEDDQARFRGWGGDYMEAAGAELVVHYKYLAFMGFVEVFVYFNRFLKYIRMCKQDILSYQPDVVILIDFGGFNIRIARFLKKKGIKVFYYISPKVWAWNTRRAETIKANVDRMFVILPFEKDFYQSFGYQVDYIGNPVMDAVRGHTPDRSFLKDIQMKVDQRYIALLPGSRNQELISILPFMVGLAKANPDENFILAAISNVPGKLYNSCRDIPNIHLVFDRTNDILAYAHAGVITSGTATLETAIWGVPQVVVYRSHSKISFFIGRMVVKIKFISLVNLIAGHEVVTELIQDDLTLENLKQEVHRIVYNEEMRIRMIKEYDEIRHILGQEPASEKAAKLMTSYLKT